MIRRDRTMRTTGNETYDDSGMKLQIDQMILVAIGIVIVLLFGAWAFNNWGQISSMLNGADTKMAAMSVQMDESQFTQYDGAIISGAQVVAALKGFANEDICITVNNGRGGDISYIYADETLSSPSTNAIALTRDKTNPAYINSNSKYLGAIHREGSDPNGAIVGLYFTLAP